MLRDQDGAPVLRIFDLPLSDLRQALLESAQTPYRPAGGKRLLERPSFDTESQDEVRNRRQGGVEDLESNRKERSRTKGLLGKHADPHPVPLPEGEGTRYVIVLDELAEANREPDLLPTSPP